VGGRRPQGNSSVIDGRVGVGTAGG
jgi:hypothetical protein